MSKLDDFLDFCDVPRKYLRVDKMKEEIQDHIECLLGMMQEDNITTIEALQKDDLFWDIVVTIANILGYDYNNEGLAYFLADHMINLHTGDSSPQ